MNITQDNLDIFTGSHVEVSISNQIDNQVDFFDASNTDYDDDSSDGGIVGTLSLKFSYLARF